MGIVFIQPHIFWNFQEVLTVTYCEIIFRKVHETFHILAVAAFERKATIGNELLVCKALPHFTCNTD